MRINAADAIKMRLSPNNLPDELLAADRIMLRWAASVGDGLDDPSWQDLLRANVPELPWDVAIAVDQLVMRSEPRHKRTVECWYRSAAPREVIGHRLGCGVDEVYKRHENALNYFRVYFETSPLRGLRSLAGIDVRANVGYVHGLIAAALRGPARREKADRAEETSHTTS